MTFVIEFDREEDGRWIAEIRALPGVMAYGATKAEAKSKVEALARQVAELSDAEFAVAWATGRVVKAKKVRKALARIGWKSKPTDKKGSSHHQLIHPKFPDYTWEFADSDELGPVMLARIAKHTGLTPEDLWKAQVLDSETLRDKR
jgi:predicted RNA binding protein YcfA (HicA-like mRNA interferase family)